jgi:hypothetical protein
MNNTFIRFNIPLQKSSPYPILECNGGYSLSYEIVNGIVYIHVSGQMSEKAYKFIYYEISSILLLNRIKHALLIDQLEGDIDYCGFMNIYAFVQTLLITDDMYIGLLRPDNYGNTQKRDFFILYYNFHRYNFWMFDDIERAEAWLIANMWE